MEVEVAGLRCFGVNQQAPASNLGAELRRPAGGVGEETGAKPAALVLARHPETSHQRHRLWIAAGALPTRIGTASAHSRMATDQRAPTCLIETDQRRRCLSLGRLWIRHRLRPIR